MIILGLGSNIGDRLANLRLALEEIKKISGTTVQRVSPTYVSDALLPENAPPEWDIPHLNLALLCESTLEPLELRSHIKNIERHIAKGEKSARWSPRIIDIDILAWDNACIKNDLLTVPHLNLLERPFALWPLADVAPFWTFPLEGPEFGKTSAEIVEKWGSRFDGNAPLHARQIYQRIDTPRLVGVVNVTPDSFSDGGKWLDSTKAVEHALHLIASGAEILDIGAESTAPKSQLISADTEWQRLQPVLAAVKTAQHQFMIKPKISIDTRHSKTAENALTHFDIDWINDVTGLKDPAMQHIIADSKVDCVVMHHLSLPVSREHVLPRNQDAVKLVYEWGEKHLDQLEKVGIERKKIIFDPGIGFSKVPEHSLELIKHADVFKKLNTRVLIGHSRKTFLSLFTPQPFAERDIETLTMSLALTKQHVDYLRVHNIEMTARALRVMCAIDKP